MRKFHICNVEGVFDTFGGVLFFSYAHDEKDASDAYTMSDASKYIYEINEDELSIAERWEIELPNDFDELEGWEQQIALVEAAVEQGYDGVEDEDEQGTVYIIDMDNVGIEKLSRIL